MTVYVDNAFIQATVPNGRARHTSRWCHLYSHPDDHEELHALARKIGMKRAWFQDDGRNPLHYHYDLTEPKRRAAVKAGAVEITWRVGAQLFDAWSRGEKPDVAVLMGEDSLQEALEAHEALEEAEPGLFDFSVEIPEWGTSVEVQRLTGERRVEKLKRLGGATDDA